MIPKSVKKKLTIYAFRTANRLSGVLGYRKMCALTSLVGEVQLRTSRRRREVVRKNFLLIRGNDRGWEETFRYFWATVADTLMIPHVGREWVEGKVLRIDGIEYAEAFRGKPLIVVTGHLGNPEFLANVAGVLGFEGVAVAEVPSGEWFREFLRIREKFGLKIVPVKGAYPKLIEAIRERKFVYLVSDRKVSRERGWVIKLGCGYRRVPTGFARLSLETGTPVVFAYGVPVGRCEDGKYYAEVSPPYLPKSIEDAMEWYSYHLYRAVSRWTDRWFVFWDEWLNGPPS
jgi:KDO2-lipid IV(A) lauroyltransferase